MEKKIKILPGGPYEVTPDVPLQNAIIEVDAEGASVGWAAGKAYEKKQEPYHLCRCGHSKNKPYCDGSHVAAGFEGTEHNDKAPYLEGCKVYKGETVDLYDNESLCASMRMCDRGVGVWEAAIESGDPDNRALAVEESCACAAGRLTVRDKEGNFIEPDLAPEVSPVQDTAAGRRGPLAVKGGVQLEGADGELYETRNRMTLCRCGQSKNMPYCDISHMRCDHMVGFDEDMTRKDHEVD